MYEHLGESNFSDVGRFHTKFGLPNVDVGGAGPREVDPELFSFRVKFMLEELQEFMEAASLKLIGDEFGNLSIIPVGDGRVDHAQAFDALLDLVYVALGTAHISGYPWQQGWDRVQRANMAKVRAKPDGSDSKRGSSYDVVKPEGWTPPDIESLLQMYGWDTNL